MQGIIVVKAAYDSEAMVWHIEGGDIDGLNLEGETLELLIEKLPGAIADLLEEGEEDIGHLADTPIELIAHASMRLRL